MIPRAALIKSKGPSGENSILQHATEYLNNVLYIHTDPSSLHRVSYIIKGYKTIQTISEERENVPTQVIPASFLSEFVLSFSRVEESFDSAEDIFEGAGIMDAVQIDQVVETTKNETVLEQQMQRTDAIALHPNEEDEYLPDGWHSSDEESTERPSVKRRKAGNKMASQLTSITKILKDKYQKSL